MTTQFGSIQTVVVCAPVAGPTDSQQLTVCPATDGHFFAPINVQAYLVDPSQQGVIEASIGPFDYAQASGVWFAAFSMVVGLYFVSTTIGAVLGLIRRG